MAVKIRLQRKGRKKAPFYFIVVADARAPRDGRFIEKIGTYNPLTIPATIHLDNERAFKWLKDGAQPSDTVRAILRFKGVMYQKHLDRGVRKGALTEEQAAAELARWIEQKEAHIDSRREATADKKRAHRSAVDGTPKVKAKPAPAPAAEEAAAETEEAVAVAEETAVAVEETPVVEEVVAAVEETPAAEEVVAAVEETPAVEEVVAAVEETPAVEEVVAAVEETPAVEEEAPAAEETSEEKTAE